MLLLLLLPVTNYMRSEGERKRKFNFTLPLKRLRSTALGCKGVNYQSEVIAGLAELK